MVSVAGHLNVDRKRRTPDEDAMKLSEARILYLAREALMRMRDEGLAEIPNFNLALRQARELVELWEGPGDAPDAPVRPQTPSIKPPPVTAAPDRTTPYTRSPTQ